MKLVNRLFVPIGLLAGATLSFGQVTTATYIGADGGTWSDARNWDTGLVPDANTNVIIDGKSVSGEENYTYELKNILITGFGAVETKAGSTWLAEDETLSNGSLIHRATSAMNTGIGTLTILNPIPCLGVTCGGVKLNPTPKTKRTVVLQSSAHVTFGLGGSIGASAAAMGVGTYATLTGEDVTLGGEIDLESYYGFNPSLGQQFQIITSTHSTTGQFEGLNEGDIVGGLGGYDMKISYVGGDGDDVVLTAVVPEPMSVLGLAAGLVCLAKRRRKRPQIH